MRQRLAMMILFRHLPLLFILTAAPVWAQGRLTPDEAHTRVGESATVCGIVASAKYAAKSKGAPTFLNLGKPYPQHVFTAIVWGRWRSRFPYPPEELEGRSVCITGTITIHRGVAEIEVHNPLQIEMTPAR